MRSILGINLRSADCLTCYQKGLRPKTGHFFAMVFDLYVLKIAELDFMSHFSICPTEVLPYEAQWWRSNVNKFCKTVSDFSCFMKLWGGGRERVQFIYEPQHRVLLPWKFINRIIQYHHKKINSHYLVSMPFCGTPRDVVKKLHKYLSNWIQQSQKSFNYFLTSLPFELSLGIDITIPDFEVILHILYWITVIWPVGNLV